MSRESEFRQKRGNRSAALTQMLVGCYRFGYSCTVLGAGTTRGDVGLVTYPKALDSENRDRTYIVKAGEVGVWCWTSLRGSEAPPLRAGGWF